MPKVKTVCKNCGQRTTFGDTADVERVKLGWCSPCFVHSRRTFVDKDTSTIRYYDELRTIDGIKSRYNPK
jgi:hypothetical protein